MRKWVLSAQCLVVSLVPASLVAAEQEAPPLVVFISVDQMRADYVDRFGHLFEGGLKRLMTEGAHFTNVYHAHALTETAPGHATLVTGTHPSRHGIVANEWWDRVQGRRAYAAEDTTATILGVPELLGRSPANVLRSGLSDWLKQVSPDSKVFSIAIKDRVAALMGGRDPDGVFWYDYELGRYVTSTYYADEYPPWLEEFNLEISTAEYVGRKWERFLPEDAYDISAPDSSWYEHDGVHVAFPHVIDVTDTTVSPYQEFAHTPYGDGMTLSLARLVVEHEGVGADRIPDLLFIGVSSSDLIGHRFGPFSQEMQDHYVRLDRMLGEFFQFLDEEVGSDRYVVVLTSDHGSADIPEHREAMGLSGKRVSTDDFGEQLLGGLTESLHEMQVFAQPVPLLMYPLGLVLRFRGEEVTKEQLEGVRNIVASSLREAKILADVVTYGELQSNAGRSHYWEEYMRSYHPDRAADILIRYREFDVFPASIRTNHGTPYEYDQHVPLFVAGPGLAQQVFDRRIWTVDVAPTVAGILQISTPQDLDGTPIEEVITAPTNGAR